MQKIRLKLKDKSTQSKGEYLFDHILYGAFWHMTYTTYYHMSYL